MENEMGYTLVKGPQDLEKTLNELLSQAKLDPVIKNRAHYILYELGDQKSLIKMDLNKWPVAFWHYDLLGRPATSAVKDVLARFAWDKCGEKEWYFKTRGEAVPSLGSEDEHAFSEWRKKIFEARND